MILSSSVASLGLRGSGLDETGWGYSKGAIIRKSLLDEIAIGKEGVSDAPPRKWEFWVTDY